jgi:hypothetical protein
VRTDGDQASATHLPWPTGPDLLRKDHGEDDRLNLGIGGHHRHLMLPVNEIEEPRVIALPNTSRLPEACSRTVATASETVMFGRTVSVSRIMCAAAESSGRFNSPRRTVACSIGSNVSNASRLGALS